MFPNPCYIVEERLLRRNLALIKRVADETGVEMYIVSIDQAQDAQKVMPLVDGNGWEYNVLLDPNGTLKRAMNVQNVPHLFVLNSKGEIVYNHAGYMDGEELEIRKYLK